MATIRRRGRRWLAEVWVGGRRKGASHHTKAAAIAWAQEQERLLATGAGAPAGTTVADLLRRYARDVSSRKRSRAWEAKRITALLEDEIAKVLVERLAAPDVAAWRDRRRKTVSDGTVRRDWNLLQHACEVARNEWHWLPANPFREVERPASPPPRQRVLSDDEIERLCYALGHDGRAPQTVSERVAIALLLALETAMRASELTGLTWDRVDLERRVARLVTTKNGHPREVPLSREAVRLLGLLDRSGQTCLRLTTRQLDALFRKARDRAGIANLHFHDSRATAITRLAKRLSVLDLARMSGHRDLRMLSDVYYRESAEQIAERLG